MHENESDGRDEESKGGKILKLENELLKSQK